MSSLISKIIALIYSILAIFGIGTGGGGANPDITVESFKNISYGTEAQQTMDIYVPSNAAGRDYNGVIVYVHGGAWVSGDKDNMTVYAQNYAKKGYITASINYRMPNYDLKSLLGGGGVNLLDDSYYIRIFNEIASQGLNADTICQDIDKAVSYLNNWFKEQGLNVDRMALSGDSAGAHEAMLYAYNGKYTPAIPLTFLVDRSGPSDMSPSAWINLTPIYNNIYVGGLVALLSGNPNAACLAMNELAYLPGMSMEKGQQAINEISPAYYVNENTVPTIMCYGMKDLTVPPANAQTLREAFEKAGNENFAYFEFANSDHTLAADSSVDKQYTNTLAQWLADYFGY